MDQITRELSQLHQLDEESRRQRVWWCNYANDWRTNFPPPEDLDGEQEGEPDDGDYERELTAEEEDAVDALRERDLAPFIAAGLAEREAWLAACREEVAVDQPAREAEEPAMT